MKRIFTLILLLILTGCAQNRCPKTYDVHYLSRAEINIDGIINEPAWKKAISEKDFIFSWEQRDSPLTEFRAFCDDEFFYFCFQVHDEEPVFEEKFESESVVDVEDRVEIFFSCDERLKEYYCLEVDPLGRVHDYAASYYRKFDSTWKCSGLRTAASITKTGYEVEGSIPLKTLDGLGLPSLHSGSILRTGLFRAEFSRGEGPELEQHWISWVDLSKYKPDFHIPAAFGCMRMVK
ncbi:MAG: carbohydrate-binding family 9-like protein [Planctomycetota bacterium]